ncbi:MAG: hypothetical protein WAW63_02330 [Candidatus Saccharimonadales bacterium]|nr:hypothetical protein [Candidatus Saccharibacteria bacterium]
MVESIGNGFELSDGHGLPPIDSEDLTTVASTHINNLREQASRIVAHSKQKAEEIAIFFNSENT